jgi:TPP-dependent pyruvate/acetoin dehydrogenase alpha subunit
VADDRLTRAYQLMVMSRAIDDACDALMAGGHPVPNYHGARGQEALYAGVGVVLDPVDYLLYNYRAFATLLAKGVGLTALIGDLMMNQTGTTRGHGGIMHVHDRKNGIVGRNGVFGSKFGIALGLAQRLVLGGTPGAVACMFGEAEGNRGGLYEAINLAVLRRLPVVFLAENNGYAVAAPTPVVYGTGDMSSIWSSTALPVRKLDGNDVRQVIAVTGDALQAARAGQGPAFIELVTTRLDAHHAHDDQYLYRTAEQLNLAWAGDPIRRARAALEEAGVDPAELDRLEREAHAAVDAAVDEAGRGQRADMELVYAGAWYGDKR